MKHMRYHIYSNVAHVFMLVLNFWKCNGRNGQARRTASACHILSKSVETRPIYVDFSIIQDGHRRYLWFLKLHHFNGRDAQEGEAASPCQTSSKAVKPRPRYGDFSIFKDGGRRHLGLLIFENLTVGNVNR